MLSDQIAVTISATESSWLEVKAWWVRSSRTPSTNHPPSELANAAGSMGMGGFGWKLERSR